MGEVRFMISEAAKQVHVESHVLRYWEEELDLKIGRTEMGHRYYTEDDIRLFRCIKKLKNEGVLLRDLKPLIPKLQAIKTNTTDLQKETSAVSTESSSKQLLPTDKATTSTPDTLPATFLESEIIPATQLEQARQLLGGVLNEVVVENNKTLEKNISQKVTEDVLREMEFLFQSKERLEEEHYRKLDCLIRQQQNSRKESAKDRPLGRLLRNLPLLQ